MKTVEKCLMLALAMVAGVVTPAHAVTIDWVTVGDVGNAADSTGYGAVGYEYRIGKYEFTMGQYVTFLNAVDPEGTNPFGLYNVFMGGGQPRSGIRFDERLPSGAKYQSFPVWNDKPVNLVNWFDAARVANWLHAGGVVYGSTAAGSAAIEDGAYTLNGSTSGPVPGRNAGARYWIPTENEWYKAAYYKGGGTSAGYWEYATQSDAVPVPVNSTADGVGMVSGKSPVVSGNFANFDFAVVWNGHPGNLTSVGSNGGPSAYGAFDMSGNVDEWNDLDGHVGPQRGDRGGNWANSYLNFKTLLSASDRLLFNPSWETLETGFRLAGLPSSPVPEIDPAGMGSVLALVTGVLGLLERRRLKVA
jgi:formylglycine-generating enzyme required for sulfatase activity